MSTIIFDIFKKNFIPFYQTNVRLLFCSYSPVFKNKTYVRLSVKWEKTDSYSRVIVGRIKNQNKCSIFPTAYKLVHLHTNLKIKPLNQNHHKPTKIPLFHHPLQNPQYRTQYRQTLIKSILSPTTQPKFQLTIQTTFFLYKYENPKKINIFTDYWFRTKFTCKSTSNFFIPYIWKLLFYITPLTLAPNIPYLQSLD